MKSAPEMEQPFILATISGKGGVGKSMSSVHMAEALQNKGYRVALIDADIGLSNCSTLLNEPVPATVGDWINNRCHLDDVLLDCPRLTLVTGSDNPDWKQVDPRQLLDGLDQIVHHLAENHDFILIDTPAGASEITFWSLDQADLGILLLMDEPTSISDVYRLCKYVYSIDPDYPFAGLVNRAAGEEDAEDTFQRFNSILHYFLKKKIPWLGFIPDSDQVRQAVRMQQTLLELAPDSPAQHEFNFIAEHLIGYARRQAETCSIELP